MMRMMFLARSPRLGDIFMDQEHNFQENELGDDQQNIPQRGIFSAQMGMKKMMKTIILKTYMSRDDHKSVRTTFLVWN